MQEGVCRSFFFGRFKSLELGRQLRNLKKKYVLSRVGGEGGNILLWVSQDDFGVGKRIGEPKFLNISLGSFRYSTIHRRRSLDGFFFFRRDCLFPIRLRVGFHMYYTL